MENTRNKSTRNIKTLCDILDTPSGTQNSLDEVEGDLVSKNSNIERYEVIFIEPFYGGSHKQLIDILRKYISNSHLITLTPKKWHWRARCSSLIVSSMIPEVTTEKFLFCSSVLSLAELLGLRPDLFPLKKIIYFHENQLVYPIREIKARDIQYAYNQITTCLAADLILFNSHYNKNSFLDNLKNISKIFPDYKPKNIKEKIDFKCQVLYFPLELPLCLKKSEISHSVLRIVWPHRWEFDKDPETFLEVLLRMKSDGLNFQVALLGETFTDVPEIFMRAKDVLKDEIINYGFVEKKADYYKILQSCHVAVSTAKHEFFGVSMLEASVCGCVPLVPNRLVYPEIYPKEFLYEDEIDLYLRLKEYCINPKLTESQWKINSKHFRNFFDNSSSDLLKYLEIFK
ncbi:hypothetical protein ILUMI_01921 [Ignelater luminosus]|uniref:tRNA-queuosine alpha-mannosyltransferase n=1 Tax=Ignelater luminosus TaxID=2038154 RepID=A0A8K0DHD5_IGNLU|nr:hypothetical protein ILUMI_01921 [Ignelater luminosus]